MISDPDIIKNHLCTYNLALLKWAKSEGYPIGLGTMSQRKEAYKVLDVLGIRDDFNVINTIQDVEHGKPDPEIYNLIAEELRVAHSEAIAVEDSFSGVKAALSAQISCVAVPSDFTRAGVHNIQPANNFIIVDNQTEVLDTVNKFISRLNSEGEKAN